MTGTRSGTGEDVGVGLIGVGLISVGWMGRLHTRAYQALPSVYPDSGLRPRLMHAVEVIAAAAASPESGTWQLVPAVPAVTFGGEPVRPPTQRVTS
jgi:hypothetical protein